MARTLAEPVAQSRPVPFLARLAGVSTMMQAHDAVWGYVFLIPWVLGLIVFWLGPIFLSLGLSFTQYDAISDPIFIGLKNYDKAFFPVPLFWSSILLSF